MALRCLYMADVRGDYRLFETLLTSFGVAKNTNVNPQGWQWTCQHTTLVLLGNFIDRYSHYGSNRLNVTTRQSIEEVTLILESLSVLQRSSVKSTNALVVLVGDHELGAVCKWPEYEVFQVARPGNPEDLDMFGTFVDDVLRPFVLGSCDLINGWPEGPKDSKVYSCSSGFEMDWFKANKVKSLKDANAAMRRWIQYNNQAKFHQLKDPKSPVMSKRMALMPQEWVGKDQDILAHVFGDEPAPRFVVGGMPVQRIRQESYEVMMYPPQCVSSQWLMNSMLSFRSINGEDLVYYVNNAMADVFCQYDVTDRVPQLLELSQGPDAMYLNCAVKRLDDVAYTKFQFLQRGAGGPCTFDAGLDELEIGGLEAKSITYSALVMFKDDRILLVYDEDHHAWMVPMAHVPARKRPWTALSDWLSAIGIRNLALEPGGKVVDYVDTRIWIQRTKKSPRPKVSKRFSQVLWAKYDTVFETPVLRSSTKAVLRHVFADIFRKEDPPASKCHVRKREKIRDVEDVATDEKVDSLEVVDAADVDEVEDSDAPLLPRRVKFGVDVFEPAPPPPPPPDQTLRRTREKRSTTKEEEDAEMVRVASGKPDEDEEDDVEDKLLIRQSRRYVAAFILYLVEPKNNTIFMVRGTDKHGWMMPGGQIERGETPVKAALREFEEETGHTMKGIIRAGFELRIDKEAFSRVPMVKFKDEYVDLYTAVVTPSKTPHTDKWAKVFVATGPMPQFTPNDEADRGSTFSVDHGSAQSVFDAEVRRAAMVSFLRYKQLRATEIISSLGPGLLKNDNNSCYQDVVYHALFTRPNSVIRSHFLDAARFVKSAPSRCIGALAQVKLEMTAIFNTIQGTSQGTQVRFCSNIRRALANCGGVFAHPGMQDSQEFLLELFDLFQFNRSTVETAYLNPKPGEQPQTNHQTIVDLPIIDGALEVPFEAALHQEATVDDHGATRTRIYRVIVGDYLVVYCKQRVTFVDGRAIVNHIKIKNIPDGLEKLRLSAIIVHDLQSANGGHYTAYILGRDDKWYHYNDIGPRFDLVGSFAQLQGQPMFELGVLYFYT